MRFAKTELQDLLSNILLTRRLEEALGRIHREMAQPPRLVLTSGLEAVSVGACRALSPRDALASSLPTVGCLLARGIQPAQIVSQFIGDTKGPSRGRDGLASFGDLGRGIVVNVGHGAAHVSVMAGLALSFVVRKEDRAAVALVSNREMATGDFHEGLNFAAVRRVPLVVIAVRIPRDGEGDASPEVVQLYERAKGYGLVALPVDGSDPLSVAQVTADAIGRAKSGGGPTFIEANVRASAEPSQDLLARYDWVGSPERSAIEARVQELVSDAMRLAVPAG